MRNLFRSAIKYFSANRILKTLRFRCGINSALRNPQKVTKNCSFAALNIQNLIPEI